MESDYMLEVRLIHEDGTCAVFTHIVSIYFDKDGIYMLLQGDNKGMFYPWHIFKSIKVVKK